MDALLALAPEGTLRDLLQPLAQAVSYNVLRRPEAGLLMVEGKTGGTRFNLGEMLVTRCAVSLSHPPAQAGEPGRPVQGYAWICGNRPRHAELAALGDALMQPPGAIALRAICLTICAIQNRKPPKKNAKSPPPG